ncbi:MAG TPA: valine--tRNA ligase [Gemmatimonadaceae bacterium]|jgi:valyl-tRNA synthetase
MTEPLAPQFDFVTVEREIYRQWLDADLFTAHAARSVRAGGERQPFTIVIPPPNVTAVLHMGHGLNNAVQDVIVRWRRMAQDETLWVPGTDHAGIATQNVVERIIAKEGKSRFDLGRDAFVERVTEFVTETGGTILEQLRAIGSSCDWSRTAYTFSPPLSRAVREAFVRLYEEGFVYRGNRVIHWCPRCLTSLSDEEAEPRETSGRLYYVTYRAADGSDRSISVATTRPETIPGDVAVAVNPADERYRELVGTNVVLPLVGIEIPVIADDYVDASFGTGALKITPGHDTNDFEVGRRHSLPTPVVIDETGAMREVADARGRIPGALLGLDRFEARDRIVEMLRDAGALTKTEPHQHNVRACYRCETVIEPRLSDQWFVRMQPLAEPALAAVRDGKIRILPERWEAVYINWLEQIRDWNISRQLWWGHRIPVWYCDACGGEPIVSRDDVSACPNCGGAVRQDEDVLDTWFSSWLWPLSTLGWPDEGSEDLESFYPTDDLVTAPEIIFFWVARMIMAGYHFAGRAPFHTVYLTGTVRDIQHRKMSKSLGNGIDPLDVVHRYGADALRYTVIAGMGMGTDLMLDPDNLDASFAPGRNFVTKLWNIGRFLLSSVSDGDVIALAGIAPERLTRADEWILDRLDAAIREADASLGPARPSRNERWASDELAQGLRLSEYVESARRFVWNELADWYVEAAKARVLSEGPDRDVARAVLVHVFDQALRLLHPVVPFVTEALWQRLPGRGSDEYLARATWPSSGAPRARSASFELAREAVSAIRQIRAEYNVAPGKNVEALLVGRDDRARAVLAEESALVGRLARATVTVGAQAAREAAAHALLPDGSEVSVLLAGLVDVAKECARVSSDLAQLEKQLGALEQRLANESFVSRARPDVVESERKKLEEWSARREQLTSKKRALCGA